MVRVIPLQRWRGCRRMYTHAHTHSCMYAHMLAGLLSGPLGHLAACLERCLNMRGHIKASLCLCGCLECQQSALPWWKSQVTLSKESSTSCLCMHIHLLLQHSDVILTYVPGVCRHNDVFVYRHMSSGLCGQNMITP